MMNARAMPEWCSDPGEIARLLRWLKDGDGLDLDEAIYIVSKPWKWDQEYQEMCMQQRRTDPRELAPDPIER
jgi:hypothetical protein